MTCVLDFLFDASSGHEEPCVTKVVVGDLGMGLSRVHHYLRGSGKASKLETYVNGPQTYHVLFYGKMLEKSRAILTDSERVMVLEVRMPLPPVAFHDLPERKKEDTLLPDGFSCSDCSENETVENAS